MTSTLTQVIETALKDRFLSADRLASEQKNLIQGLFALAAFFILVGIGFFLYVRHTWSMERYDSQMVTNLSGIVSIGVGLLLILAGVIYLSYCRYYAHKKQTALSQKMRTILSALDEELGEIVRDYPKATILAAALAGYMIEERL